MVSSVLLIVLWLVTGPLFKFSDTWQLVINTATTIITFIMVFVIQNSQNRDGRAIQTKLDALLRLGCPNMDNPEVRELLGIEENPERVIKDEQESIRNNVNGE